MDTVMDDGGLLYTVDNNNTYLYIVYCIHYVRIVHGLINKSFYDVFIYLPII